MPSTHMNLNKMRKHSENQNDVSVFTRKERKVPTTTRRHNIIYQKRELDPYVKIRLNFMFLFLLKRDGFHIASKQNATKYAVFQPFHYNIVRECCVYLDIHILTYLICLC